MLIAVGALLIAQPFGQGDTASGKPPPTRLEAKAAQIEAQLAETPADAKLLRSTTTAWIEAGNERISHSRLTGVGPSFPAIVRDYRTGLEAWRGFLRQTSGEASTELAEMAGSTYFRLTEIGTRDLAQLESDIADSVAAMRIASRHNHTLFTLSNVAFFEYFNGEFDSGERMAETARTEVTKELLAGVEEQFVEYRERAEVFRRQLQRARGELRRTGNELLPKPLKVYRSSTELNTDDPTL